jgi:CO dehydrogenase/acetyl-CoA synthase alpha subunit
MARKYVKELVEVDKLVEVKCDHCKRVVPLEEDVETAVLTADDGSPSIYLDFCENCVSQCEDLKELI